MKPKDFLLVHWLDSGSHIDHGWAPAATYIDGATPKRMEVDTVGILMHEDDDVIVVGLSYDPAHDAWYGAQLINKGNIIFTAVLGQTEPLIRYSREN